MRLSNQDKLAISLPEVVGKGYSAYWNYKGRYRVCKGSRASKKSKTTALWYITNMIKHNEANTLVVRKTFRTLKDSCFTELKWAMRRLGVEAYWEVKESPLELTYKPTGQKIFFRGLDDPMKVTSITVEYGRLCWMWIEEAFEILTESDFDMLDESIRGEIPEGLFKQITLTLNPWNEHHWIKKRFFDKSSDEILAMTTNYLCNEWLDKSDLKVFETMEQTNPRRYRVAGLGEWGIVDGLIYEKHRVEAFDVNTIRATPNIKAAFNLDFGYTDPNAFVCELVDNASKTIYVFDEWYRSGATNKIIAQAIKDKGYGGQRIICDCQEAKSIAELKDEGIKAEPSRKGKGSVNHGIQLIQNYTIVIHPNCTEFYKEISNYCWKKDKNGKDIDTPEHEFSHGMDSMRYGVARLLLPDTFSFD